MTMTNLSLCSISGSSSLRRAISLCYTAQNINDDDSPIKKTNRHTINLLKAVSFFLAPPLLAMRVIYKHRIGSRKEIFTFPGRFFWGRRGHWCYRLICIYSLFARRIGNLTEAWRIRKKINKGRKYLQRQTNERMKFGGWCRKKRCRAAFWFKLTELIFTKSFKWQGFDPVPGPPDTPSVSVNPSPIITHVRQGKKKFLLANSVWTAHLTLYFIYKPPFNALRKELRNIVLSKGGRGNINNTDSDGHSRTPQGDNWHCFMPTACILLVSHAKFVFLKQNLRPSNIIQVTLHTFLSRISSRECQGDRDGPTK